MAAEVRNTEPAAPRRSPLPSMRTIWRSSPSCSGQEGPLMTRNTIKTRSETPPAIHVPRFISTTLRCPPGACQARRKEARAAFPHEALARVQNRAKTSACCDRRLSLQIVPGGDVLLIARVKAPWGKGASAWNRHAWCSAQELEVLE